MQSTQKGWDPQEAHRGAGRAESPGQWSPDQPSDCGDPCCCGMWEPGQEIILVKGSRETAVTLSDQREDDRTILGEH